MSDVEKFFEPNHAPATVEDYERLKEKYDGLREAVVRPKSQASLIKEQAPKPINDVYDVLDAIAKDSLDLHAITNQSSILDL